MMIISPEKVFVHRIMLVCWYHFCYICLAMWLYEVLTSDDVTSEYWRCKSWV